MNSCWKYEPLGKIAKTTSGGTPNKKNKEYYGGTIPWVRSGELNNGTIYDSEIKITQEGLNNSSAKVFPQGTLLIALYGATIGKLSFLGIPAATNQAICAIFENEKVILNYLYYFLLFKRPELLMQGIGGAQPNISQTILKKLIVPYPVSKAEQEKIVTQIEESLSQLDSAVETLKKTKQQLEVYRQAVLREVFSRCEQSVEIKTVCKHVTDGDHMPPPKAETGIPFIMISNINGNTIDWSDTSFVGKEYYNTIGDKRTPQKGDVLYTVTGSFGIPVLIDFEKEFCFQRHIALLRPNEKIEQEFLYYALQDNIVYAQASKRATGTAQKTVGLTVLRTISIPFTTSKEKQTKMVSIIKNRLSQCDMVEKTVNQSLQQAEALRQSILKQAFEGT